MTMGSLQEGVGIVIIIFFIGVALLILWLNATEPIDEELFP